MISVIIAVLNGAQTLASSLDSVLCQDYRDKELIVIDGGSTDGSMEILKAYSGSIDYWVSEPDSGIYQAWNKGLRRARGGWVTFIGSDDTFADPGVLTALAVTATADTDLVFSRALLVDGQGRVRYRWGEPWDWRRMKHYQVVAHPGALHRRGLLAEYGCFDERYQISGDYDFLLRVGARARTKFMDRIIVHTGDGGCSRTQPDLVLSENRAIQSSHPEIGPLAANYNYVIAHLKARVRMLRERMVISTDWSRPEGAQERGLRMM